LKRANPFSSKFVVSLYTAAILLWLLGRLLSLDRPWWFALLNTYSLYCFLPLPFLFLLAFYKRQRPIFLPLLIPFVSFLFQYGELFLPTLRPAPTTSAFTAMTFNVLYSNRQHQELAAAIRAASPDIVGLQEAAERHQRVLGDILSADYPHQFFHAPEQHGDVALLSRYPIEQATDFPFPPRELVMHAIVNINGRRLHVFVAHLMPTGSGMALESMGARVTENFALRAAEIERLRQQMSNLDAPAILLCDCNLTPPAATHHALNTFLTDSFQEAGWSLGHTGIPAVPYLPNLYLSRIDYIWHTPGLTATRITTGSPGSSDHLPVTAELHFTP
jgi:endonuclease/exonuclease/phosphatase (EEP) superfamily protein YafD